MRKLFLVVLMIAVCAVAVFRMTAMPQPVFVAAAEGPQVSSTRQLPEPSPFNESPARVPAVPQSSFDVFSPSAVASSQDELTRLCEEFLQIARGKAEAMTLEELRKAVPQSAKELAELRAKRELEAAVQKLNHVVETFPDSQAAQRAKELLDVTAGQRNTQSRESADE